MTNKRGQLLASYYVKAIDWINRVVGWFVVTLLAIMTIVVFYQVLSRYIGNFSSSWTEEFARFLMVWLVLLGCPLLVRNNELIGIDLIPELLKENGKKRMMIIAHILSIFFYLILIVYGFQLALDVAVQTSSVLYVSMFWPYLALPTGGVLLLLNSVAAIVQPFVHKESIAND